PAAHNFQTGSRMVGSSPPPRGRRGRKPYPDLRKAGQKAKGDPGDDEDAPDVIHLGEAGVGPPPLELEGEDAAMYRWHPEILQTCAARQTLFWSLQYESA